MPAMLGEVYRYDAEARERDSGGAGAVSSGAQRSGDGETEGLAGGAVRRAETEPNSGLGEAITYLLRHWKALTTFLREAGAPLDNPVSAL